MALAESFSEKSVRTAVSEEEWKTRVNLAACYRLVAHYGWTDLIFTHISARVPGTDNHFLLNPYGLMFEEITASSLVKLDTDGDVVMDTNYMVNAAGFTIHSAIHQSRHDVDCVMHTHTVAGMAVSAQKSGLLPLAQTSLQFYDNLAYHDYEGIAFDLDERDRLVGDLGDKMAMILRNHGLLTCGKSVAQAFTIMHSLEKSCQLQIAAQAGGDLILPTEDVCRHTAKQFTRSVDTEAEGELDKLAWSALLRQLDRVNPGYDA
jgi:ribulose-5-phosphate 4-epimerase/fuculose-1-phosphate aldolase